ncbi:MAG: type III polyketide synthase [Methylocella sp.]
MNDATALVSVATASPPHNFFQRDVASLARSLFGERYPDFERLSRVFLNTGIVQRQGVKPVEWYLEPRAWPERTQAYLEGARDLFVAATELALSRAGLTAAQIDTVVAVSSTGIATPSLEARAAAHVGFRRNISRVPIFGLGCAGGVTGLSIASRLAQAQPGTNVLFVAVELCTLALRLDELTPANIVATSLFGDGAAACIVRAGDGGDVLVEGAGEYLWPDTLDIMGWSVDPEGFGVIFQSSIPAFVHENMRTAVSDILARFDLSIDDVERFICHPGGARVVKALEAALSLGQGSLDHERSVLADHGNMSAPTVLFVLERMLKSKMPNRAVMTALGPGFTASCVSLRRAA